MHPVLQVLLGSTLLALLGPLVRILSPSISPDLLSGLRGAVVLATVLIWHKLQGRALRRLPVAKDPWLFFGALCIAANAVAAMTAISLTSTATALLLTNSSPIYLAIYAWLFDRKTPDFKQSMILVVSISCVAVFLRPGLESGAGLAGIFAGVIGGFTWAGYIYAQSKLGPRKTEHGDSLAGGTILVGNGLAAALLIPVGLLFGHHSATVLPFEKIVFLILFMGVVQSAIPALMWAKALAKVDPNIRGLAPTAVAVQSPLLTRFFLGEKFPGGIELLAAVVLHALIVFAVWKPQKLAQKIQ